MSDDDEFETISEARGLSIHSDVESWGEMERLRRVRQELAGVGRRAAVSEFQRRRSDRSLIVTAALGFGASFAMLFTTAITIDAACRQAVDNDIYSRMARFCRSHDLPRSLN